MKAVVILESGILDSDNGGGHPMEAVMGRRGYVVYRAADAAEAIEYCQSKSYAIDLAIADVPLKGSASLTDAAAEIRRACPEIPILLVSDTPLEQWAEEDFRQFEKLIPGRIDLLRKPLSQASFLAKVNALMYAVSYPESRRIFATASAVRSVAPDLNAARRAGA